MDIKRRHAVVFIMAGCLLALTIGWVVWRLTSPPTLKEARHSVAETSEQLSTHALPPLSKSKIFSTPHTGIPTPDRLVEVQRDDPFLAPHAVIAPRAFPAAPTRFFRPPSQGEDGVIVAAQPEEPEVMPVAPAPPARHNPPRWTSEESETSSSEREPEPEPTREPTAEPEPTPEPEPSPEPSVEPSVEPTPEPSSEPTSEPEPEPSESETPSESPSPTPSPTPTVTPSFTPTPTPSASPTTTPART